MLPYVMGVVCVASCCVWYRGLEKNVVFIVIDSCMVFVNDDENHVHFESNPGTTHNIRHNKYNTK